MALWNWTGGPRWTLVVDTNLYAGNFDRELCAYVIGQCDEHGQRRASPYLEAYRRDFGGKDPFEELSEHRILDPGDDGVMRAPFDHAPTPGPRGAIPRDPNYNSIGIFLSRRPRAAELRKLAARARLFATLAPVRDSDVRPRILSVRLVREENVLRSYSCP